MTHGTSPRIAAALAALPLRPDMRVLEIGCGPGVAARAVSRVLIAGKIVAIDRSAKAIAQAVAGSAEELESGWSSGTLRSRISCSIPVSRHSILPSPCGWARSMAGTLNWSDRPWPGSRRRCSRADCSSSTIGRRCAPRIFPAFLDSAPAFP